MATQPIDTAKVYALTAAGACSVTLTQGDKTITWEALHKGGQTSFVVPAGASVSLSDTTALLSPLPFKVALGAGSGSTGGAAELSPDDAEKLAFIPLTGHMVLTAAGQTITTCEEEAPTLTLQHAAWVELNDATTGVLIRAADTGERALQMQLIFTPNATVENAEHFIGTEAGSPAAFRWLFGAPPLVAGYTYILTLTQTVLHGQRTILGACSAFIPAPIH